MSVLFNLYFSQSGMKLIANRLRLRCNSDITTSKLHPACCTPMMKATFRLHQRWQAFLIHAAGNHLVVLLLNEGIYHRVSIYLTTMTFGHRLLTDFVDPWSWCCCGRQRVQQSANEISYDQIAVHYSSLCERQERAKQLQPKYLQIWGSCHYIYYAILLLKQALHLTPTMDLRYLGTPWSQMNVAPSSAISLPELQSLSSHHAWFYGKSDGRHGIWVISSARPLGLLSWLWFRSSLLRYAVAVWIRHRQVSRMNWQQRKFVEESLEASLRLWVGHYMQHCELFVRLVMVDHCHDGYWYVTVLVYGCKSAAFSRWRRGLLMHSPLRSPIIWYGLPGWCWLLPLSQCKSRSFQGVTPFTNIGLLLRHNHVRIMRSIYVFDVESGELTY